MTDKRTFPGAMNAEQRFALALEKAEQARVALRIACQEAKKAEDARKRVEQEQKNAQRRNDLINKFAKTNLKGKAKSFLLACVGFNIVAGAIDHILADQDPYDNDLATVVKTDEAVREAYDPYFHAADHLTLNSKAYRDSTVNDRFKRHMVLVCVEALVLACAVIGILRKRRAVTKDVDIMLEIEKFWRENTVNKQLIENMMAVAPEIVSHMSSESSVYFEMLMKGNFDCEQNPQVLAITKAILAGHLHSHPEDMKRVLEVFDEASLPQSLVAKYKQNVR